MAVLICILAGAALSAQPSWRVHWDAGKSLIEQGKYREAEPQLLGAVRESGDDPLACNELAALYQLLGKHAQAERFYLRAAGAWEAANPEEPTGLFRILNNLATLYLNMEQFDKAQRVCLRILNESHDGSDLGVEDHARLRESLGRIYCSRRQYGEAEGAFRQAEALWKAQLGGENAEVAAILNNLGLLYLKAGRREEAISHLERSIAIWKRTSSPDSGLVPQLATLGTAYMSAGRFAEAENAFREAVRIAGDSPGFVDSHMPGLLSNYATLLGKTKRRNEAKEMEARAQAIRRELVRQNPARYTVGVDELGRE